MQGVADADLEPMAVIERLGGVEQPEDSIKPAAAMAVSVGLFRLIAGIEFNLSVIRMDRKARAKVTEKDNPTW